MRTTDSDPSIVWILLVNAQGDMTSYYIPSLFCCLAHHDDIMSLLVTFTNEQSSNAEDDLVSRSKEIFVVACKSIHESHNSLSINIKHKINLSRYQNNNLR